LPYGIAPDVQKRVPWITWLSPGFQQRTGVATDCLRGLRDARVSHDNYFHAVLGLMQVRTSLYRRELDPYAACAAH
jgi:lipid A ethanolaminephosphotransferase